MSELFSQEAMDTAIEQWIFAQKKKAEENSTKALTERLLSETVEQLQDSLDQNKPTEAIIFAFKGEGLIIGSVIGGAGESVEMEVHNKEKRDRIYERVKEVFIHNLALDVREKQDDEGGDYYKEISIKVKVVED